MTQIATTTAGESAALSRDLADFLIELSIALHKNAIYPEGHPLLDSAVAGVERRLAALLLERGTLALGVARQQLVIEGVATDPNHPLLRELAGRLHRHHLGAVRFSTGATRSEIGSFLHTVATDAGRTDRPLGLEPPEALDLWHHIRLFPLTYEQLELLDEQAKQTEATATDRSSMGASRASQLWIGLARAAMAAGSANAASPGAVPNESESSDAHDPAVVARAIDEHAKDVAYDQVVVGYLLQIAGELKSKQGKDAAVLQQRISRLVATLQPETLERLLEMGGDFAQRQRFVLDATQGMAVDAVVDLVRAAAATSQQTISHSMIRMLTKFAAHAEQGTAPARPEADVALRDQVQRLLTEWNLSDPNPEAYREALERMSRLTPAIATAEQAFPPEPERMVQMGLELGVSGDAVWRAVDAMVASGRFARLLDLLDEAPEGAVRELVWVHARPQERLRELTSTDVLDAPLLTRLVARLGLAAAEPLLDALERVDERRGRALADLVATLGTDAAAAVAARLTGARAAQRRVLLNLLARFPALPPEFNALPHARHADATVRREALRIMLRHEVTRESGICAALADPDDRLVRYAMGAALAGCPRGAMPMLMRKADDQAATIEMRTLAIRVLATVRSEEMLDWLLRRTLVPKRLLVRARLAPKTPEMVAALAGLAATWSDDERAEGALSLARISADPELRAASTTRGAGATRALQRTLASTPPDGEPALAPTGDDA
jgi:hypothetical protein